MQKLSNLSLLLLFWAESACAVCLDWCSNVLHARTVASTANNSVEAKTMVGPKGAEVWGCRHHCAGRLLHAAGRVQGQRHWHSAAPSYPRRVCLCVCISMHVLACACAFMFADGGLLVQLINALHSLPLLSSHTKKHT